MSSQRSLSDIYRMRVDQEPQWLLSREQDILRARLKGSYPQLFQGAIIGNDERYAVLGSIQPFDMNEFTGKPFICSNNNHIQQHSECSHTITNSIESLHANVIDACDSMNGKVFYTPFQGKSKFYLQDSIILPRFVVVLESWIDGNLRKVVIPSKLNPKYGNGKSKSIFEIASKDDWIYYANYSKVHFTDYVNWQEYTYSIHGGPFINLQDALGLASLFNCYFVDERDKVRCEIRN